MISMLEALTGRKEKEEIIYNFSVRNEDEEIVFTYYVVDANHGYIVFKYNYPQERKTEPEFNKWFLDKNEAIEYAYETGKSEKLSRGY